MRVAPAGGASPRTISAASSHGRSSASAPPEADARSVADLMVEADLQGYDTHGVFRLKELRPVNETRVKSLAESIREICAGQPRARSRPEPSLPQPPLASSEQALV